MGRLLLTFDIEDFINPQSVQSLLWVLKLLKLYNLNGLFFLTGHVAEKLEKYTSIINLLEHHSIGYHSSSHSVRPIIPEFTDIDNYQRAIQISSKREQSHINPLTGEIQGHGGIQILRKLFKDKNICSFRAPGNSWSPPHSEALAKMGIVYDFSSPIHNSKVFQLYLKTVNKAITFFPVALSVDDYIFARWSVFFKWLLSLFKRIFYNDTTVLLIHPAEIVNSDHWDRIYFTENPKFLTKVGMKSKNVIDSAFNKLRFLLYYLRLAQKAKCIEITTKLNHTENKLTKLQINLDKIYWNSTFWPRHYFSYEPIHLKQHFYTFFQYNPVNSDNGIINNLNTPEY